MLNETIPQQFLISAEKFDKEAAFRYKENGRYVNVSHREAVEKIRLATLGLQAQGMAKQDRIALLSENRFEWAVADLAILSAGCICVPVWATQPVNQVEYILADSEARAVFVSNDEQLAKVLECRSKLPALQQIISFDPDCEADGVITMDALIARGRIVGDEPSYEKIISTLGKYDWASIIYTSGTTGEPQGAILTHWNFLSNIRSATSVIDITSRDTCLSFLPLSHVLERMAGHFLMLTAGATIAYAESKETVLDDMSLISPTVMLAVPRFFEKLYAGVHDAIEKSPGVKKKLFNWAVKTGEQYFAETQNGEPGFMTKRKRTLADKLVFGKLKARTGGKIRFFVSGGAPLAQEINRFFHVAGLPILEGYGLTETSPVIAVNTFAALKIGSVGRPIPGVDVIIADDGEILTRGDNVMQGYYNKPEKTNEVIVDGWFRTGDIGRVDDDGFLIITDRKKDLIVTAGSKNVAPQALENRLKQSRYIEEAIVIGNGRKFIVAVVAPDFDALHRHASQLGIQTATDEELVRHDQILELYAGEIDRLCEQFASFEQIKKFVLIDQPLTIETGELTPSLKVKRRVIEEKYKDQIDALYTTPA